MEKSLFDFVFLPKWRVLKAPLCKAIVTPNL